MQREKVQAGEEGLLSEGVVGGKKRCEEEEEAAAADEEEIEDTEEGKWLEEDDSRSKPTLTPVSCFLGCNLFVGSFLFGWITFLADKDAVTSRLSLSNCSPYSRPLLLFFFFVAHYLHFLCFFQEETLYLVSTIYMSYKTCNKIYKEFLSICFSLFVSTLFV